jgi:hypothetical protein
MKEIFIESPKRAGRRGYGGRSALLVCISSLMVSGVFAILFTTQNSSIQFGQSLTPVSSCAAGGTFTITPSSVYSSSPPAGNTSNFEVSGFSVAGTTSCNNDVLSISFIGSSGPLSLGTISSNVLTTFEIEDYVSAGAGIADLVTPGDVAVCTTSGTVCYKASDTTVTALGTVTASDNGGSTNNGSTIMVGGTLINNIDAGSVSKVVMQTSSGFTSTPS